MPTVATQNKPKCPGVAQAISVSVAELKHPHAACSLPACLPLFWTGPFGAQSPQGALPRLLSLAPPQAKSSSSAPESLPRGGLAPVVSWQRGVGERRRASTGHWGPRASVSKGSSERERRRGTLEPRGREGGREGSRGAVVCLAVPLRGLAALPQT